MKGAPRRHLRKWWEEGIIDHDFAVTRFGGHIVLLAEVGDMLAFYDILFDTLGGKFAWGVLLWCR